MDFLDRQLRRKLLSCKSLPSPPKVAERIIELSQDKAAGADEVAVAVGLDPGLVTKVLQVASSPIYFRGRTIDNLSQAVVLLGLNTILNLALSLSLVSAMRKKSTGGVDYQLYWRRSLIAATCARALCGKLGVSRVESENFFLAGLLQDVGMLALNEAAPSLYLTLGSEQLDHQRIQEIERGSLGTDHAAVGAWLLEHWNLPEYIQLAVAGSHDPAAIHAPEEHRKIVACTAVSGSFADVWLHSGAKEYCEQAATLAANLLEIEPATAWPVLQSTAEKLAETSKLFGIDIGDAALIETTLSRCEETLAV